MVFVEQDDLNRINDYILRIEREIRDLNQFLNSVSIRSDRIGFLAVGDVVEVWKKPENPNDSPSLVISRAKIPNRTYRMHNLELTEIETSRDAPADFTVMSEDFNSEKYDIKKIYEMNTNAETCSDEGKDDNRVNETSSDEGKDDNEVNETSLDEGKDDNEMHESSGDEYDSELNNLFSGTCC